MGAPDLRPATCPYCSCPFQPKRPWQRFCSTAHRRAYHKATGGGDLVRKVADLEERVHRLEGIVHP
jgi:hypothetical protein